MAWDSGLPVPVFAKPPADKSFTARVYRDGGELPVDLPDGTAVLVGEVVAFAAALPGLPGAVVVDVGLAGPPDEPRASLVAVEGDMACVRPHRTPV
ncbi:hypothetical protein ACIQMJ_20245 [Actinosynnema sp. NPDC091369]